MSSNSLAIVNPDQGREFSFGKLFDGLLRDNASGTESRVTVKLYLDSLPPETPKVRLLVAVRCV